MNDRTEDRAAKLAESRGPIPPSKLAHYVRRTSRLEAMLAWYRTVLGADIVHSNGMLAFLTYDDEHHRIAFISMPGLGEQSPGAAGTDHVAYNHRDLGDLLSTYARLKRACIEPYWCVNHGVTTSLYYRDPDGNGIEFQLDNFTTLEEATRFMRGPAFAANPIGVIFDPEALLARYRAGEPIEKLLEQPPLPEGATPLDMIPH